jgi:hypothetical protein
MLRTFTTLIALALLTTVAHADCASNCNNGFDVCMRNCWGQAGCRKTCSRGRSGCLRRCGQSDNFTPVPFELRSAQKVKEAAVARCDTTHFDHLPATHTVVVRAAMDGGEYQR